MTNKYNRRSRPNLRHVCDFWKPSTEVGDAGELVREYVLHYRGPFAKEIPRSPIEITDGGRVQGEQAFYLIGQWCEPAQQITEGMFCTIPALKKVFAVSGEATDQWGDQRKVRIIIIDNVSQVITSELMPTLI